MKKMISIVTVALVVAWCLLVILSWLLSATMVEGVRSMLTSEGIRWFLGHAADELCRPLLAWLLMGAMAWGCLKRSRLLTSDERNIHRKAGLRVAALLLLLCVGGVLLLTALPHAVLLSATGTLWHSPFSHALVPMLCFTVALCAIGYGLVVRSFTSVADIVYALVGGLADAAPILLLYMLATPFFASLCYVFFIPNTFVI